MSNPEHQDDQHLEHLSQSVQQELKRQKRIFNFCLALLFVSMGVAALLLRFGRSDVQMMRGVVREQLGLVMAESAAAREDTRVQISTRMDRLEEKQKKQLEELQNLRRVDEQPEAGVPESFPPGDWHQWNIADWRRAILVKKQQINGLLDRFHSGAPFELFLRVNLQLTDHYAGISRYSEDQKRQVWELLQFDPNRFL